ncbi:hypothetical protein CF15_02075 [Pyrodictium occultum]|uniref:Uncharacterized protein n=1 Tax=Pyrodictium occultum TaxID=2309 RepID=A0A0V8RUA0_PYROC|nr:hypothetical protein [Pyrodictium occultum]KSW11638.1 hypothetical protein CF15_02075 [Pyrodictium occultum]
MLDPRREARRLTIQLENFIRVLRRIPGLEKPSAKTMRGVIADFLKYMSDLAVYAQRLGVGSESLYALMARCSKLLTEVGWAIGTLDAAAALQEIDTARAVRSLAERLVSDPCMGELEEELRKIRMMVEGGEG